MGIQLLENNIQLKYGENSIQMKYGFVLLSIIVHCTIMLSNTNCNVESK